jgi:hypothetical protein
VGEDGELAVAGEVAQRGALERQLRVVVEVVEELALEDEEAARDVALGGAGLLVEAR